MNEAILIWVYLSLGSVVEIFKFLLIVLVVTGVVTACFAPLILDEIDKTFSETWDDVYKYIPTKTLIFAILLTVLYPSKEDLKYIIGGSLVINGVQAASEIEGVEKLPKNLVNAMNHFLEDVAENDKK